MPGDSSTVPQAAVTVKNGGIFGIATAATDVNEQKATAAPTVAINVPTQAINAPTKSVTDGSVGKTGGSGVTTDAVKVPGGAGRAELGLGMGMWIMVTVFGSSILGTFVSKW